MDSHTVDSQLLDVFQKASDRIQDWIGITCFTIAKRFFDLSVVGAIITIACQTKNHSSVALFTAGKWIGIIGFLYYAIKKYGQSKAGYSSSAKIDIIALLGRALIVFCSISGFVFGLCDFLINDPLSHNPWSLRFDIADSLSDLCALCSAYFCSCDPKPPRTSKVKKIFQNLTLGLKPQQKIAV